jgi:hypothetical protein
MISSIRRPRSTTARTPSGVRPRSIAARRLGSGDSKPELPLDAIQGIRYGSRRFTDHKRAGGLRTRGNWKEPAMMRSAQCPILLALSLVVTLSTTRGPADAKPPQAAGKKTYLLRYRFRANSRVRYRVTSSTEIRQVKGSARMVVKNETAADKHFDVTAVDDKGNALLEPVIDAVLLSAQWDDGPKKTYDSRSGKPPLPQFARVAKTIGKPLVRLKVTPNGKLLQAVPLIGKKTRAAVVKNNGPATPSNDPSRNFLVELPEKPVRVGDAWADDKLHVSLQVDRALKLFRSFVVLRNYRLVAVKDGLATIELTMATKRPVNKPQLQVQLVQRLLTGTIVFDLKRGVIVSRTLSTDNKVFGYAGPQSMLHVKMTQVERLVDKRNVAGRGKSETR